MVNISSGWEFVKDPSEGFFKGGSEGAEGIESVRLPHTAGSVPMHSCFSVS